MITGVMIYEDANCNVLTHTMNAPSVMTLDAEFKMILDSIEGALIQLTYVNSDNCTVINSEGLPV